MLTSLDLQNIQNVLKKSIKASLDRPDCDFDKVKELVSVMERVDPERREMWNKGKFGVYEEIATELEIANAFAADDIPF